MSTPAHDTIVNCHHRGHVPFIDTDGVLKSFGVPLHYDDPLAQQLRLHDAHIKRILTQLARDPDPPPIY